MSAEIEKKSIMQLMKKLIPKLSDLSAIENGDAPKRTKEERESLFRRAARGV